MLESFNIDRVVQSDYYNLGQQLKPEIKRKKTN
jgi:hypothetical protein